MADDPKTRTIGYVIAAVLAGCILAVVIALTWRIVQAILP